MSARDRCSWVSTNQRVQDCVSVSWVIFIFLVQIDEEVRGVTLISVAKWNGIELGLAEFEGVSIGNLEFSE